MAIANSIPGQTQVSVDLELNKNSGNAIANSAVAKAIGDIDAALAAILGV